MASHYQSAGCFAILTSIGSQPCGSRSKRPPLSLPAHPPVELDKYEILQEIGHGGMATVYRARDRRLNREVAIKVIHRHLRESPEVGRRFQSEARAVAKVKHPNIVEVYDVSSEKEEEKYLVVELIRGITLRQLLIEQGALPPEIAACIAVEVCRAIAVAHREGVVHRDIKPENVLLSMGAAPDSTSSGGDAARVKLTDFGIAKLLDAQGVTHTGQVLGSPAHMAPEQIEGGDVDARADIFGTGVLFYEMLTGVLPFEGKNPAQVLRKVLEGITLPPERQSPRAGSAYGQIALKALSRDPDERYSSAPEFEEVLLRELRDLGVQEVRTEIGHYLDDPQGYKEKHEQQIPDVLARLGREAREHGEILRAAALFNRALAYRPDDTQLLADVVGLARRDRFKRRLLSLSFAFALLSVVAGASFWWISREQASEKQARASASSPKKLGHFPPFLKPVPEKPPSEKKRQETTPADPAEPALTPRLARPKTHAPRSEESAGVRSVVTPVVGPQNARVRIDGQLLPWFQKHNLSVGPHTFEFVPPNVECCETSPPRTVDVVAGEGDQVVRGVINFRPAVLRLQGPPGSRASCGIGDMIEAGSSKSIPMNRPSRPLNCTIFPPPEASSEPKRIDVDLRPGRTFTLTST
jgi:serine/threonine protein kinase